MFAEHYAKYYDLFNEEKPYEEEIKFVYEWAEKPRSIIDIGCGTANYWRYFPASTSLLGVEQSIAMSDPTKNILYGDITKRKIKGNFDCATALFDVVNYIPTFEWWANLPIKKGGYFIFDIWDAKKVEKEGFSETTKKIGLATRTIRPVFHEGKTVTLRIDVWDQSFSFQEQHDMYVHSQEEIEEACAKEFEIIGIRKTKKWQKWYKLKRK